MKMISLRELHSNTGKWARRAAVEDIMLTERGVPIAKVVALDKGAAKKTWASRTLRPGYAALMKAGKLKTGGDSTAYISEDRTSRDDSIAGVED